MVSVLRKYYACRHEDISGSTCTSVVSRYRVPSGTVPYQHTLGALVLVLSFHWTILCRPCSCRHQSPRQLASSIPIEGYQLEPDLAVKEKKNPRDLPEKSPRTDLRTSANRNVQWLPMPPRSVRISSMQNQSQHLLPHHDHHGRWKTVRTAAGLQYLGLSSGRKVGPLQH